MAPATPALASRRSIRLAFRPLGDPFGKVIDAGWSRSRSRSRRHLATVPPVPERRAPLLPPGGASAAPAVAALARLLGADRRGTWFAVLRARHADLVLRLHALGTSAGGLSSDLGPGVPAAVAGGRGRTRRDGARRPAVRRGRLDARRRLALRFGDDGRADRRQWARRAGRESPAQGWLASRGPGRGGASVDPR